MTFSLHDDDPASREEVNRGAYVEERVLLAAIGEPYREFMATRKRIVPFVY